MSVRLDDRTERALRRLARRSGRTKSDVIRTAIETLERQDESSSTEPLTAYDRVSHLIGGVGSGGKARLSERTGPQFRALVEAKHRARRPR